MTIYEQDIIDFFNEGVCSTNRDFDESFMLLCDFLLIQNSATNIAYELGLMKSANRLDEILPLVYLSKYNFIIPIIKKLI